ncbi:MAG: phosphopentomutase [Oscillospiraceae bacterium]|nr:phosphopentomutase [Oscillospiraceae bacterium]
MKRVFLVVLDSFGIGAMPDAYSFGDSGANTLKSCFNSGVLNIPNLTLLGLSNIDGVDYLEKPQNTKGVYLRLCEKSAGKDTTTGHFEIAGVVLTKPLPTYPNGFPKEIIEEFESKTGRGVLCNKTYSGTEVIKDYGKEHLNSGDLIVYTSADSVFQIAAHEQKVSLDELYECCRIAREILKGEHAVGRVIARPFVTEKDGSFKRTANRRDFSLKPPKKTMLDFIKESGKECVAVGKITDIFANEGITKSIFTHSNSEGIEALLNEMDRSFEGLCFVNLVDFDMLYGHRNNAVGYSEALNYFDSKIPKILEKLQDDDLLIITADHGCDPADISTDHTREYVPLLIYKNGITSKNLGTKNGFDIIAKTVCDYLGAKCDADNISLIKEVL